MFYYYLVEENGDGSFIDSFTNIRRVSSTVKTEHNILGVVVVIPFCNLKIITIVGI